MKNLKKVLALVLVVAMMMTFAVSASAAAYEDADQITDAYSEAVDVMSAVGVFNGTNGNLNPQGNLSREEAAKIICYLVLGKDNAEKLTVASSSFTDVEPTRWSAPFIEYCASKGIVSGHAGKFNPKGTLKGVEFAKMLLVCLGYDATIEKMVGASWEINTANLAIEAGIDNKFALSSVITREQAVQMAFSTMTATMVKYSSKGTSITMGDGTIINTGASDAAPVSITGEGAANYAGGAAGAAGLGTQQFCEKYYSELRKDGGVADDFGRGASYGWYLDKNNSGAFNATTDTYVYNAAKTAVVTYTAKTAPAVIAKDLKGYTFGGTKLIDASTKYAGDGDNTWNETLSIGALNLTEGASAANGAVIATAVSNLTENGTVVEIYVTNTGAVEDVIVITSTVETIVNITTAANGNVTYDFSVTADKTDYADNTVNADEIVLHGTVAKGDVVTTVQGTNCLHVYPTTKVVGAQSAYNTTYKTITVGGKSYPVGTGVSDGADAVAVADFSNSATEANYYIDQYGYVVKTDAINVVYTNYAQVKGHTSKLDVTMDGSTPVVEARFVLADGTVATYNVKVDYNRATGVYSIAGTTIGDIDVDGDGDDTGSAALVEGNVQGAVNNALTNGTVFAYSLNENTISLQAVKASNAEALTAGAMVVNAPDASIAANAVKTAIAKNGGNTVLTLLDKDTIYVLYDAVKKTATKYVGALPAGATLTTGSTKVVACGNSATVATAKVVFGVTNDVSAIATADYAYVSNVGYTEELTATGTRFVYEGVKADGSKVTLYASATSTVPSAALYTWNDQMVITGAYTGDQVKTAANYTVVGDQMISGENVYNMANAKVVYIDATKTTVNGNSSIVVLATANGRVTTDVEAIFVVG